VLLLAPPFICAIPSPVPALLASSVGTAVVFVVPADADKATDEMGLHCEGGLVFGPPGISSGEVGDSGD